MARYAGTFHVLHVASPSNTAFFPPVPDVTGASAPEPPPGPASPFKSGDMGKGWRRKRQKKNHQNLEDKASGTGKSKRSVDGENVNGRGDGWIVARDPSSGKNIVPGSPVFEAYYQAQSIVEPGVEWKKFMETLAMPLPASFRVNLDCDFTEMLVNEIETHVARRIHVNGKEMAPIKRLEFFQGGHAYQMAIDRHTLRKDSSLAEFHELMKTHTEAGTITRQETVSMIPPVVLGVQPHHKVLDMCAAPGSKTSQMLETLSRGCSRTGQEPSGYIVANDSDTARAYMLVHQCRRINTVALCVTTHKAQLFPARGLGRKEPAVEAENPDWDVPRVALGYFDRILCDVPCSGDGTVRKTFNIWRTWSPGQSLGLHPMQYVIARRGAALLKVGGLMVYSTCTLNPIENEAVVLSLLQDSEGALELVDPRPLVPGLIVRPGLHSWRVMESTSRLQANGHVAPDEEDQGAEGEQEVERTLRDSGLTLFRSYEDVPEPYRRWIRPSCFPPKDPAIAERLKLHYCMRCLPHDQDTGGFFIALFKKTRPLPKPGAGKCADGGDAEGVLDVEEVVLETGKKKDSIEGRSMSSVDQGATSSSAAPDAETEASDYVVHDAPTSSVLTTPLQQEQQQAQKERRSQTRKTFVPKEFFVPLADDGWASIKEFYGVKEGFPRDRLFLRRDGSKVVILLSQGLVEDVQLSTRCQLQLVNAGTRIFDRASTDRSACAYRLSQDGMPYMLPYLNKRVVQVGPTALAAMTVYGYLDLDLLGPMQRPLLEDMEMGSFVAVLEPTCLAGVAKMMEAGIASFALMCWRGFGQKMNVMCIAHDLFIFQCRLKAARLVSEAQLVQMRETKSRLQLKHANAKGEGQNLKVTEDIEQACGKEMDT